jgi:hypothetical protein
MDANATTLQHIVQHVCVVTFPLHIFTMLPLPLPLGLLLLPLAGKAVVGATISSGFWPTNLDAKT